MPFSLSQEDLAEIAAEVDQEEPAAPKRNWDGMMVVCGQVVPRNRESREAMNDLCREMSAAISG